MGFNDTTPNKSFNVEEEFKEVRETMSFPNTSTSLDEEIKTIKENKIPVENLANK